TGTSSGVGPLGTVLDDVRERWGGGEKSPMTRRRLPVRKEQEHCVRGWSGLLREGTVPSTSRRAPRRGRPSGTLAPTPSGSIWRHPTSPLRGASSHPHP